MENAVVSDFVHRTLEALDRAVGPHAPEEREAIMNRRAVLQQAAALVSILWPEDLTAARVAAVLTSERATRRAINDLLERIGAYGVRAGEDLYILLSGVPFDANKPEGRVLSFFADQYLHPKYGGRLRARGFALSRELMLLPSEGNVGIQDSRRASTGGNRMKGVAPVVVPSRRSKQVILVCKRETFRHTDIVQVLRESIGEWTGLRPDQVDEGLIYDDLLSAMDEVLDKATLVRFIHDIFRRKPTVNSPNVMKQMASALSMTKVRGKDGETLIDLSLDLQEPALAAQ